MPTATLRRPAVPSRPAGPRIIPKPSRSGRAAPPARSSLAKSGRLEYRALPFQASATTADGSYFEGYCAVINNIDEYGTIMGRGCFDADIDAFRADGFIGGLNHNWDEPIGRPEVVRLDGKGLFVGGHVLDTSHGADMRKWLKAGVVRKMSFGFDVIAQEYLGRPEDVMAYWQKVGYTPTDLDRQRAQKGALLFTRVKVYEASPVTVAGNQLADITEVRSRRRAAAAAVGRRMASKAEVMKLKVDLLLMDVDAHAPAPPRMADPRDVAALRRELLGLGISIRPPQSRPR